MINTERLYFDDPYLHEFTARVVARRDGVQGLEVALDRSAFYPEGGGQPGDRGTLNEVMVLDTQVEDHLVWHRVAGTVSDEVRGQVDGRRRLDFMQQHHGQHLLSAAFEQLFAAPTVAVHMGEETCTVDIERTDLTPAQLVQAEDWTNAVIYRNLPINARFVDAEELATIPLRKPPKVYERIRIVSVDEVDHSACGGTHPHRTGEVGIVALRRWERRGTALRIEFLCGGRALRDYRAKTLLLTTLATDLSVASQDLPDAVARLRNAEATSRKALDVAKSELRGYEAIQLLQAAEQIGGMSVVVQTFVERTVDDLRFLAKAIADGGGIALLALRGEKAQFVFARATNLKPDMSALLREAALLVGGKGGGKPEAAQGGGPDVGQIDAALARVVGRLREDTEP